MAFAYTDNTNDRADDLSIEIADPQRTWMQSYLPKKGVECTAQIKVFNWKMPGDSRLVDCGVFWLDEISFAGPPNVVSVKATSVPVITGIKSQKKFRSWEDQDLQSIVLQIATENKLALVWDTAKIAMKKLDRVDQVDSPDLEFVRDKVKEIGLSLKIYKRQLVVYSEEEYEARPPLYTITYGMSNILAYSFTSKLDDTFKDATISYVSPKTGELLEGNFGPPKPAEGAGATIKGNERVVEDDGEDGGDAPELRVDFPGPINTAASGSADAEQKAKAKLRDKNKKEKECSFVVVGNPGYISGLNVQLVGFGIFDGKWFIDSSSHEISSSGYITTLGMRAALEGY
jgi:phage protein D